MAKLESELSADFGVTPSGMARIRDTKGRFVKESEEAEQRLAMDLGLLASQLADNIRYEFASHNRSGESLKTLRVDVYGREARVSMGGGAPFVEFGTAPHIIEALGTSPLHWTDDTTGEDAYAWSVEHPGTQADDFIGRAEKRMDFRGELNKVATETGAETNAYVTDKHGNQYTAGQQFGGTLSGEEE